MADLRPLKKPYELYDVGDGDVLLISINGWEMGSMLIHPGRTLVEKVVDTLRIHVPETDKEFYPYYWDITSGTLISQLIGYLQREDYKRYRYQITKHGTAPRARFSLKVIPK